MLAHLFFVESRDWRHVDLGSILILCIVSILFWFAYNVIFNRYFHPLCNFPGPFWGTITDFYNTYLFATGQAQLRMLDLHDK